MNLELNNNDSQYSADANITPEQVLLDFYEEQQTCIPFADEFSAIGELKRINQSLENLTVEQQNVVLDYYCQDPAFASIVGSENRVEHLQQKIKEFDTKYSEESILLSAVQGAGIGLYIGKQIKNRTIDGCYKLCKKVNKNTLTKFDAKLVNIPSFADFNKHLDNLIVYCEAVKAGATDPKKFTTEKALTLVKSLGFKNVTEQELLKWSAVFRSAFFGTIKSIGWTIVGGLGAVLVSIATMGVGALPASIAATAFIGYKSAKSYHDSYSKGLNSAGSTLTDMGYNAQNVASVCEKYVKINDILRDAAAIKSTQSVEKQKEDAFKGTVNILVTSLKGTASVIANILRHCSK